VGQRGEGLGVQLAAAVTQGRKPRIAIVLECQNQAQIQTLYGYNAPTILSQPYTKFMLATSDPKSAKWLEEAIGEEETDRIRESRSVGGRSSATENLDRHTDPLVMRSQIENLSDLNGYLKVRGLPVVPIQIRYPDLEPAQPAFIRRTLDRELIQLTAPPMMPPPPTKPAGRGFTVVR
jgi:type IV secretory pathway TraG/TraD family ATPase VirD4